MLFENLNYLFENFQKKSFIYLNIFKKKLNILFEKFQKKIEFFIWRISKKSAKKIDRHFFLIPNILKVSSLNCEQLLTRASTLPQNETLHEKMKKIPKIRGFFLWRFFSFSQIWQPPRNTACKTRFRIRPPLAINHFVFVDF